MTKPFKFEPGDFSFGGMGAAERSNEILQKHLESCPVVYGNNTMGNCWRFSQKFEQIPTTHKAILFNLEEIEKKYECEHDAAFVCKAGFWLFECKKCLRHVKPIKWEAE